MNNHSHQMNPQDCIESRQNAALTPSRWLIKLAMCLLPLVALTLLSHAAFSLQKEGKKGGKEQKEQKEQSEGKMLARQRGESLKVPEGATVSGNSVALQSGYKFVKQGNGNFAVARMSGGVSGEFKCSCKSTATKQGSCDFSTLGGTTATCNNNGCNDCRLDIVVTGIKATAAAAAGKTGTIKQIQ